MERIRAKQVLLTEALLGYHFPNEASILIPRAVSERGSQLSNPQRRSSYLPLKSHVLRRDLQCSGA
jgi:hypothetical protein